VVGDGEEVADDMRTMMENPNVWPAESKSSRGEAEERLESTASLGASEARQRRGFAEENHPAIGQKERTRERKRGRQARGCGAAPPRRYQRKSMADCTNFDEEFCPDGGVSGSGARERWKRGRRGLIRKGLKARGITGRK
jgi:hypothetical protein